MKYYERFISCPKCHQKERQTAGSLPLNSIGTDMEESFENSFRYRHARCGRPSPEYTTWQEPRDGRMISID